MIEMDTRGFSVEFVNGLLTMTYWFHPIHFRWVSAMKVHTMGMSPLIVENNPDAIALGGA
jgi:hypothetical protein